MKRIEILLLLLATILAGCEKINNKYDSVQSGIKSNTTKLLDKKADSEVSSASALTEQIIRDSNSICINNFPKLNNPNYKKYNYPLYSPLMLNTFPGLDYLSPQNKLKYYSKPLWTIDSLNYSFNNSSMSELYNRNN